MLPPQSPVIPDNLSCWIFWYTNETADKGSNTLSENEEKSNDVLKPQNKGLPTVALPMGGRLVPLKAVPEKRKDVIPERKYSYETPPDPISASYIKEKITSEGVVVGGGISGMG